MLREERGTGVGERLDLMPVDGHDEICAGGEEAIDGPHPDTRLRRDVTNRRNDPRADEHCCRRVQQRLLVASGIGPLGPYRPLLAVHHPILSRAALQSGAVLRIVEVEQRSACILPETSTAGSTSETGSDDPCDTSRSDAPASRSAPLRSAR